jgi:Pyruvate/2-oxoglutarate dehydrogenase complex, dihydrolipoamide dehydrogenase (E3) component, and related enzymes
MPPAAPDVEGLDRVASLDSTSIMELDQVPEHLIVLGGGYIGLSSDRCSAGSAVG